MEYNAIVVIILILGRRRIMRRENGKCVRYRILRRVVRGTIIMGWKGK